MGNGDGGLKKELGVGDPAQAGSDKQSQEFKASFQGEITAISGHLTYTATNAEAARHDPLAARRDALYPSFQSALGQIDRTNQAKAHGTIGKVLGDARALKGEVAKFRQEAEKARNDWQSCQTKFDEAVKQTEELEKWEDPKAETLRGLGTGIQKQANDRKYAQACTTLDQLLPRLKPIYEEYLKQKTAKEKYDAQFKILEPKLPKSSQPVDKMSAASQKEIAELQNQMESAANAKDFVKALECVDKVSFALTAAANRAGMKGNTDPEVLYFEGKELRADPGLLYKVLVPIAESKGIMAMAEFSNRLHNASPLLFKGTERPGLYKDILTALGEANRRLDREREEFCTRFESTANEAARGLLEESKKRIEEEIKRLGISGGMVQTETGNHPNFNLSNADAAKGARKAAGELLVFAKAVEKTGKESADAFQKLSAAQQNDPFNLMNRPLVENHEARRKQWMEASESYEKVRRTQVAANPSIALFTEEPGVVAKLTALASMSDADLANKVGEEAQKRLENIEKVRGEIGKKFVVWGQPHLKRVTLDQMKATSFQREAVEWQARKKTRHAADDKMFFAVLAIGLGLVAAIPTGGTGLLAGISVAAGLVGAGLALYQVGAQVNEYTLAVAANATAFDKANAISLDDPDGFDLAMNCVMALGDVFAAAAAFKALGGIVKAVKGGNVAAALKLAGAAESVGIKGTAKSKIIGEAVAGLNGEAIESVAKSMAKSAGKSEPEMQRVIRAAGTKFQAQLEQAMKLMENIKGRIPDTARKMVRDKRVLPLNGATLQAVYGPKVGLEMWSEMRGTVNGFYSRGKDMIFLAAADDQMLIGTLIHEATHRVGKANVLRGNDFMSEAIAHFAERDFYILLYGEGGPLYGANPASNRIQKMLAMSDEKLMLDIEIRYSAAPRNLSPQTRERFANVDGVSPDDVVRGIFEDIADDYKASLPKSP